MEEIILNWNGETHFYINFKTKKYGLRINKNDKRNIDELKKIAYEKYKIEINKLTKEEENTNE